MGGIFAIVVFTMCDKKNCFKRFICPGGGIMVPALRDQKPQAHGNACSSSRFPFPCLLGEEGDTVTYYTCKDQDQTPVEEGVVAPAKSGCGHLGPSTQETTAIFRDGTWQLS